MRIHVTIFLCSSFYVAAFAVRTKQGCGESKCKGPLRYYKDLGCTAVYKNPEDCCPYRYDCDQLKNRSTDKCYVNGKEYGLGEQLKDEDANPCDIDCTCTRGVGGVASFNCAVVDCFYGAETPGCYRKSSPLSCCPGEEVCPENPGDRATCRVDGKEYKDGEYFSVAEEPEKNCFCQPGFKGEFVEPFCAMPRHPYCSPDFRNADNIHKNCAPVYYSTQSPQTSCSLFSRCQNDKDKVIKVERSESSEEKSDDTKCKFGNLEMNLGDELNQATDYNSDCVKCVCEVPPVPTCQRLPDEECDITNQPPFNDIS